MNNKRKRKYLGWSLQGNLIFAIVILEIATLAATIFFLNVQFTTILDHDLYAIHRSSQSDLLSKISEQIVLAASCMLLINALFLFAILRFWSDQIKTITSSIRIYMSQIKSLQFTSHVPEPASGHELIKVMEKWISAERERNFSLRQKISAIEIKNNYERQELHELQLQLRHCTQLIETRSSV